MSDPPPSGRHLPPPSPLCCRPSSLGPSQKEGLDLIVVQTVFSLGLLGDIRAPPLLLPRAAPLRCVLVLSVSAEQAGEVLQPTAVLQEEGGPAGTQR